jgi:hypothetical protein
MYKQGLNLVALLLLLGCNPFNRSSQSTDPLQSSSSISDSVLWIPDTTHSWSGTTRDTTHTYYKIVGNPFASVNPRVPRTIDSVYLGGHALFLARADRLFDSLKAGAKIQGFSLSGDSMFFDTQWDTTLCETANESRPRWQYPQDSIPKFYNLSISQLSDSTFSSPSSLTCYWIKSGAPYGRSLKEFCNKGDTTYLFEVHDTKWTPYEKMEMRMPHGKIYSWRRTISVYDSYGTLPDGTKYPILACPRVTTY